MAIYSFSISNVSRSVQSSSLATLSYITAQRTHDDRINKTFCFSARSERVMHFNTLLPDAAPAEYTDPEALFNAIELRETQCNSRTAKKIIAALPREFDPELQTRVVEDFIKNNLTSAGYAATYALHSDHENNNPHVHILIANRRIDTNGKWGAKRKKTFALDENGERIPIIDKKTGKQKIDKRNRKQWKRIEIDQNPLDQKSFLQDLRKAWAEHCNAYLSEDERIDHRSYKDRGIDRIPTVHEGYAATAMIRRGEQPYLRTVNEDIIKTNEQIARIEDENKKLDLEIKELENERNMEWQRERDEFNGFVERAGRILDVESRVLPDGDRALERESDAVQRGAGRAAWRIGSIPGFGEKIRSRCTGGLRQRVEDAIRQQLTRLCDAANITLKLVLQILRIDAQTAAHLREWEQDQREWEERSARQMVLMEGANLSTSESSRDAEASVEASESAAAMPAAAIEPVVPAMPAAPASTIAAIPDDDDTATVVTTMPAPSEQESSEIEEQQKSNPAPESSAARQAVPSGPAFADIDNNEDPDEDDPIDSGIGSHADNTDPVLIPAQTPEILPQESRESVEQEYDFMPDYTPAAKPQKSKTPTTQRKRRGR